MQVEEKRGKIPVVNGWITCPICKQNTRLLRVLTNTEATALPVFCRTCKHEVILDIAVGQSVKRQS